MKNKIKKILTFIGFVVGVIAGIISALTSVVSVLTLATMLPAIFAICFIFAKNTTLNKFGYAISAVSIADGLMALFSYDMGLMIYGIGLIIMGLASVIYFIQVIFGFFGYGLNKTETCEACEEGSSDFSEVEKYSQMLADGIITEEEYASLKAKIFAVGKKKGSSSIEDLKKWKKLYDKKLISDEEFASIKTKILK